MRRAGPLAWILLFLGGLLVWAAYFLTIYSFVALDCALGVGNFLLLGIPAVHALPIVLAIVAIGATIIVWWVLRPRTKLANAGEAQRFLAGGGRLIAILSLISIAFVAFPALLVGC